MSHVKKSPAGMSVILKSEPGTSKPHPSAGLTLWVFFLSPSGKREVQEEERQALESALVL